MIKWDTEKFKNYVNEYGNGEYNVLDNFYRMDKKLNLFHTICGNIWSTTPGNFVYNGNRCNFCSPTRRFTHQEFLDKMFLINPNIKIIGTYKNSASRISCKCEIDDYEWSPLAYTLLDGEGCPKCAIYKNRKMKSSEEFVKELFNINPNIEIIESLFGTHNKIKVRCLIDGYEWNAIPANLLRGSGCPRCKNVERYTTPVFKDKLFRIHPDIKILGEYVDHYTKIKIQCLNDGYIWFSSPHVLFMGSGCPCCCSSKGEKYTSNFLLKNNIEYKSQYYFNDLLSNFGVPLRFDFAIFNKNNLYCLIEIDGIGHRKPVKFNGMSEQDSINKYELIKYHDFLKNEYCKSNNIQLIRIYYDGKNFKNVQQILESELSPLLERR